MKIKIFVLLSVCLLVINSQAKADTTATCGAGEIIIKADLLESKAIVLAKLHYPSQLLWIENILSEKDKISLWRNGYLEVVRDSFIDSRLWIVLYGTWERQEKIQLIVDGNNIVELKKELISENLDARISWASNIMVFMTLFFIGSLFSLTIKKFKVATSFYFALIVFVIMGVSFFYGSPMMNKVNFFIPFIFYSLLIYSIALLLAHSGKGSKN